MWWADNSVKIDKICPLAIPNQIFTISMHIPSLVKIHWYLLKLLSVNKNKTYVWQMDRQMDRHMDGQHETIVSCHYVCEVCQTFLPARRNLDPWLSKDSPIKILIRHLMMMMMMMMMMMILCFMSLSTSLKTLKLPIKTIVIWFVTALKVIFAKSVDPDQTAPLLACLQK